MAKRLKLKDYIKKEKKKKIENIIPKTNKKYYAFLLDKELFYLAKKILKRKNKFYENNIFFKKFLLKDLLVEFIYDFVKKNYKYEEKLLNIKKRNNIYEISNYFEFNKKIFSNKMIKYERKEAKKRNIYLESICKKIERNRILSEIYGE